MKHTGLYAASVILAVIASYSLHGQQFNHRYDHVLNDKGTKRFTITTGIPYVVIGEYAYGISDRLTFGVLAGLTPNVEGYGIRGRIVLSEPRNDFRVYFCTPILYYPKTKELGGDPWWLIRPNINFEWITERGLRYKVGGSLIAASSHHTIFGDPSDAKFPPGVWNALHGGIALPIGSGVTFQCETSLVMNGLNVAGSDWVGGPPVILVVGVSWIL
ncbi:MAG: hypothetical protein HYW57_07365 [Ignavibacteriales bacterium]|nr:hypothetical protein [Ignavibacteriales bacterium]